MLQSCFVRVFRWKNLECRICGRKSHVSFFYPSSRNFIGPLRLYSSKSIKFSRSGPKTKQGTMGGGSSLNLLSTVKLFWLAKNKNVIHIYKIHTSLVFIATMTSLQLLLLFFALLQSFQEEIEQQSRKHRVCNNWRVSGFSSRPSYFFASSPNASSK